MDFREILFAHPYLSLAQTAFMIWMLVDAYRRQVDYFWYWIILFIPGIGSWAYFFVVKAGDFRGLSLGSLFQRRTSLEELRFRATETPTLANNLELAQRLVERGEHAEAIPYLEAVLKWEPDHPAALYSLAVCQKEQGVPEASIPLLEKLIARDARWSNDQARLLLIECHSLTGNASAALDACRELVRLAPCLQYQCMLAERLLAAGQHDESRALLDRALQEYAFAPGPIRRRNRRWAREAGRLQKQVATKA
jgi:hypothetical protein